MNNSLYSEVKGSGDNIVLLHGWGMHGGLWGKFAETLAEDFQLHLIDLPGYGFSKNGNNDFSFDAVTDVLEQYIKEIKIPVTLIGWSLGGLLALNLIQRNKINIEKLALIAATPCFTKKQNWQTAMDQSVFDDFSQDLKTDYKKTLKRFLSLQTRGSELARDELRELNAKLLDRGEPDINALVSGLDILSNIDMRTENNNEIPTLVILGEKDTLIPVSIVEEYEKSFSNLTTDILNKTGHAPFITKPKRCAENIKKFINE